MSKKVLDELNASSFKHKMLFLALICERMKVLYVFFSKEYELEESLILQETLSLIYEFIVTEKADEYKLFYLKDELFAMSPNLDDFDGSSASYASDACIAFYESIVFLMDKTSVSMKNVINAITDTIDMFIQEKESLDPNDKNIDQIIKNSSYMKDEYYRQLIIISEMRKYKKITYDDIQFFIKKNNEIEFIDLNIL